MKGIAGFIAVFVLMAVAGLSAHRLFGVPQPEAGALAFLMWPVVVYARWGIGLLLYVLCVCVFGAA